MRIFAKVFPTLIALIFAAVVLAPEVTHAQTYGGSGQFTFYSNANGQYWCYANGDVTFQSVTGAITWSTAGQPNAIPCPIPAAAATYAAPVTYSTYSTPVSQPVVVQPIVVNPCANTYGNSYFNSNLYSNYGFGFTNPYTSAGCGFNSGFSCLALGCNTTCNFPGSCHQGLPPHDHDCGDGMHFSQSKHECVAN